VNCHHREQQGSFHDQMKASGFVPERNRQTGKIWQRWLKIVENVSSLIRNELDLLIAPTSEAFLLIFHFATDPVPPKKVQSLGSVS